MVGDKESARAELLSALADATVMVDGLQARRDRMDDCGIGGAKAEKELVGAPFSVDMLGKAVIKVQPGKSEQFRVYGGSGNYSVALAKTDAKDPPKVELSNAGLSLVTVMTTATTTEGDYRVVVADTSESGGKEVPVTVAK